MYLGQVQAIRVYTSVSEAVVPRLGWVRAAVDNLFLETASKYFSFEGHTGEQPPALRKEMMDAVHWYTFM